MAGPPVPKDGPLPANPHDQTRLGVTTRGHPGANRFAQQQRFDRWRKDFNEELGMRMPADAWKRLHGEVDRPFSGPIV